MGRCFAMAARQQAAAGQGIDAAAMAGIEQGDDAVHHGQAGADQQHRRPGIQIRRRPRIPGIAEIMRRGVLVREIADSQDGAVNLIAPAGADLHDQPVGDRFDRRGLVGD